MLEFQCQTITINNKKHIENISKESVDILKWMRYHKVNQKDSDYSVKLDLNKRNSIRVYLFRSFLCHFILIDNTKGVTDRSLDRSSSMG